MQCLVLSLVASDPCHEMTTVYCTERCMTSNEPHSDVRYVSVGQTCVLASNGMPRQVDRMLGMAILFNHVRSTAAEPCRPVSLHPGQSRTRRAPGPSTRQDRQHDNPTAASNHGSSAAMGSSTYGNRYLLTTKRVRVVVQ